MAWGITGNPFTSGNTHQPTSDAHNDAASPPQDSVPATPTPTQPQRSSKRTHDQIEAAIPAGSDANPDSIDGNNSNTSNKKDTLGPMVNILVGKGHGLMKFEEHLFFLRKSRYLRTELTKSPKLEEISFDDEESRIFCRIQWWLHRDDIYLPSELGIRENDRFDFTQDTEAEPEAFEYEYEDTQGNMTHGTAIPIDENGFDEDQDSQVSDLDASQTLRLPPKSLDALELAKVYAFAERLRIPELCNMVIDKLADRLGQHPTPGADLETPSEALIYAYKRPATKSTPNYLRKILIDFTSLAAPVYDFTDSYAAGEIPPQLMLDLIRKFPMVRGKTGLDSESWAAHYEERKSEYHFRRRPQALRTRH